MTKSILVGAKRFLGWISCAGMAALSTQAFAIDGPAKALPGHVPAAVAQLPSTGVLPSTNVLRLAIGLPLRDPAGFDALLAQVYDPASPEYHHYLTPEEFNDRFGPSAEDYDAVRRFAETNGLTVTATHGNRLLLDVSGPVASIQRAFNLTLRTYRHPNENREFYAPDTEPSVGAALPVADVSGLNNFILPRPKLVPQGGSGLPASGGGVPRTGSGPKGEYMGYDFRAAYMPGVTLTGAGQIVGLFEFDGFYPSDITAYENAAGLPAVPVQTVLVDGYDGTPSTGSGSGNNEVSLDIEMAIAMAPGLAKVISFEGGPSGLQNDVLNVMAASNQVRQFSCSWGWGGGPSTSTDTIFKLMALQGQSFFTASGDSDAFTVGANSSNGVDNTGLANAPSSCPYLTAVGGTTLTTTGPGGAWSSETVWNWGLHNGGYVGSSGGVSSYYGIPSWQAGTSMAANGGSTVFRNTPDVALTADNVYVMYANGSTTSVGGTSCAAPLWAGVAALINQQAAASGWGPIGFVNPALYAVGQGSLYTTTFHDITSGNNHWSGSPSLYTAATGYDLCTGWGTPKGQALINALAGTADSLVITPPVGFASAGSAGGPFSVNSQTLTLTNTGAAALTWSLINTSSWLVASATSGTLPVGGKTTLTLGLLPALTNVWTAGFTAVLTFTNQTSHRIQGGEFTLQINPPNLLVNGGFETGDFTGWTLVGDTVSSGTIYNAVEGPSSGFTVVHSGNYGAFLGDNILATLSQTITTVPGQTYLLSLWLNNLQSGTPQQFTIRWNTNPAVANPIYNLVNPPVFSWTNPVFFLPATGTSTLLQFAFENPPNYFGMDDVIVVPLPPLSLQTPVISGNALNLSWPAAPGAVYRVQYTTSLSPTSWSNLGAAIVATNRLAYATDATALLSTQPRFYRVIASP